MRRFVFGCLLIASVAWGNRTGDAQSTLRALAALLRGQSPVETPGCPKIPGEKWVGLLIFQQPIHQKFTFAKNCDLQSDVTLQMSPFPTDVSLRHFAEGDRVTAVVSPVLTPDFNAQLLHLSVQATQGKLYKGQDVVLEFTGKYQMTSSLDGKQTKEQKGELQALRYRGHTVKAREKLTLP
jgi:hypothetical protein